MQLDTYVQQVQEQLVASAALGDDRVREVAATLAGAASPAVRLALMTALAAAADEVTAALLDTADAPMVSVRLDSDEIRIEVSTSSVGPSSMPRTDEGDASARISLRLSEALKSDIDTAATSAGVSVNTWLVRAASTALSPTSGRDHRGHHGANAQHITGWING